MIESMFDKMDASTNEGEPAYAWNFYRSRGARPGNAGAVLALFENIQLASRLKANNPSDAI